ncbi:MAG: ABC transporter permease [Planctomycetes bacterium]|nr:ABC transporter permease [Planctomycetota bacterium]
MQQFFAILKDSFREAVDGFVIYVMLALAAVLIVLVASVSFTPDSPDVALPKVLPKFAILYPDQGKGTFPTAVPVPLKYQAANAQLGANGAATFILEVDRDKERDGALALPLDGFRYAVYTWTKPSGPKVENPFANRNRGPNVSTELGIVAPPAASADDLKGVTDEQMVAFLKFQFAAFVGVHESDVTISRRAGVAEPAYAFDVQLNNATTARGWTQSVSVLFGAVPPFKSRPLGASVAFIQDQLVNGIGAAVTLMLSVVITAFFIPNMLRKGSLDLLISKPIGRVQLLVYKYIGGLTFIFLLSAFTIGGVWAVTGVRSGLWNPTFLLVVPVLTFTFAILYAVSTVIAVYTRSAIAAILITLAFMFFLYLLGQAKTVFDANRIVNEFDLPEWAYTLVDTLNNILPRYKDLDKLTTSFITDGTVPVGDARIRGIFVETPSWAGAFGVSLAFIALMLGLASWRLVKRDG